MSTRVICSSGASSRSRRSWTSSIRLFGDRPLPYHVVSLAAHCLNAGLVFWLLCKQVRRPAALIGSSLFAVHPAQLTALYWLSARADLMATTLALITVMLSLREGRERWLAVPAFWGSAPLQGIGPALAGSHRAAGLVASDQAGRAEIAKGVGMDDGDAGVAERSLCHRSGSLPGSRRHSNLGRAYALDFGAPLLGNLLTYVAWTVDLVLLKPGMRFVDRQNPAVFGFAVGALVIAGLLALWPALRRRGWLVAVASFSSPSDPGPAATQPHLSVLPVSTLGRRERLPRPARRHLVRLRGQGRFCETRSSAR